MPDSGSEPGVPSVIETATGGGVGRKNLDGSEQEILAVGAELWNPEQMLERLGGDEKLLDEVMEIFLQEVPKHLAGLRDAITRRDAESAERLAHSLQGELGYMGIVALSHGARELEEKGRTSDFQGALILLPPFESAIYRLLNSMGVAQKISSEKQPSPGSSGVSP
jgi:HPt (histidine-containing phosphotransfer) domain-containing protein